MAADDVRAHFERRYAPLPRGQKPAEAPIRSLHDARHLYEFELWERYEPTGLKVFRQVVEDWPDDRQEDFLTLFLARDQASRQRRQRVDSWTTMKSIASDVSQTFLAKHTPKR